MTLPFSTTLPVPLRAVAEAIEMQNDETTAYLNRSTGELIILSHEELSAAEAAPTLTEMEEYPQWQRAAIEKAGDVLADEHYLQLPSKFDLHEWRVMEQFSYTCSDEPLRERLLDAIHRRGAFRRFRQVLEQAELLDNWYRFRDAAFARVARAWLEANGIAYQR